MWRNWQTHQPANRGGLQARVQPPNGGEPPCLEAPDAKYRGAENQLYRVEVHDGGTIPTFKWSRDNGSAATLVTMAGKELTAAQPKRFSDGAFVELINNGQELRGEPGTIVKLFRVEDDHWSINSEAMPGIVLPKGE